MRILKILNGNDGGGIFTCEQQFIKYWRSKNIKVDAIVIGHGTAFDTYQSIVDKFIPLPKLEANYSGSLIEIIKRVQLSKLYASNYIKNLSLDESYDAIIYRRSNYIHLAGILSMELKCKSFWHMPNEVKKFIGKIYYKKYIKRYKIIPVANSRYTNYTLGNLNNYIVYPGFDKSRVSESNSSYRDNLGIPWDAKIFGTASRIDYTKAQDLMIRGFIESDLPKKNCHLIIAGGPLDTDYSKYVQKISIDFKNNIHFINKISDLPKFYASIDVYVNSRRDAEPFGISIAEAMGAGLPVLAYYKGGPEETVKNSINGWHIYKPTVASYRTGFEKAYNDISKWESMGKKSQILSSEFESDFNANKFINIINEENSVIH